MKGYPVKTATGLSLLFSLVLFGCGGAQTPASAPGSAPATTVTAGDVKAPGDAKVGDKTLCPVSKEEFTVTATSPKVEHDGKTYYFCCSGCDGKFKANPQKYLGGGKS